MEATRIEDSSKIFHFKERCMKIRNSLLSILDEVDSLEEVRILEKTHLNKINNVEVENDGNDIGGDKSNNDDHEDCSTLMYPTNISGFVRSNIHNAKFKNLDIYYF